MCNRNKRCFSKLKQFRHFATLREIENMLPRTPRTGLHLDYLAAICRYALAIPNGRQHLLGIVESWRYSYAGQKIPPSLTLA
jgi:hypothetical protein